MIAVTPEGGASPEKVQLEHTVIYNLTTRITYLVHMCHKLYRSRNYIHK